MRLDEELQGVIPVFAKHLKAVSSGVAVCGACADINALQWLKKLLLWGGSILLMYAMYDSCTRGHHNGCTCRALHAGPVRSGPDLDFIDC